MPAKIVKFVSKPEKPEKPGKCPYCGSHDTGWTWQFSDLVGPMTYFAFCYSCHTKGLEKLSSESAIESWNIWSMKSCAKG